MGSINNTKLLIPKKCSKIQTLNTINWNKEEKIEEVKEKEE